MRQADQLRTAFSETAGVHARTSVGEMRHVMFTVEGREPVDLKTALNDRGVNVIAAGRSSTYIDMEARGLQSMVRASVHYYNTEDEVKRFVGEVADLSR